MNFPTHNATKSFWLAFPEDNPFAEEGSKGALTSNADVCVIGSGITGVSAAWHLSQMMKDVSQTTVVILEAREFCESELPQGIYLIFILYCRFWGDR